MKLAAASKELIHQALDLVAAGLLFRGANDYQSSKGKIAVNS
jgi:hypothetical protein